MLESITLPLIFTPFVFLGVAFAFIPGLPAILYMLLVSGVFALVTKFGVLSRNEFLILCGIYALSFAVDAFSGVLGAKYAGASLRSVLFGIAGALLGIFAFPPFGGIAGLFVGVLLSELILHGSSERALQSATFGVLGAITGIVVNLFLATLFFSLFVYFVFFR